MRILFAIGAAVLFTTAIPTPADAQVSQYLLSTDSLRDPRSGQWVNAQVFCREIGEDNCQTVVTMTQRFCAGARARDRAARDRDDRYNADIDYRLRLGDSRRGVTIRGSVDPFASEYQGAQVSAATDVESCEDFSDQVQRIERDERRAGRDERRAAHRARRGRS